MYAYQYTCAYVCVVKRSIGESQIVTVALTIDALKKTLKTYTTMHARLQFKHYNKMDIKKKIARII